jgi:pre-mRNA-processing factor 17
VLRAVDFLFKMATQNEQIHDQKITVSLPKVNSAPEVHGSLAKIASKSSALMLRDPTSMALQKIDDASSVSAVSIWAPVQGPMHPHSTEGGITLSDGTLKNIVTGVVEEHSMSDALFDGQMLQIQKNLSVPSKFSRRRKGQGDAADVDSFRGPWAEYEDEDILDAEDEDLGPSNADLIAKRNREAEVESSEDAESKTKKHRESETSVFHGEELYDYQGRSYLHPPAGLKPRDHRCYIPKKLIHTWTGHLKPVNAIKFFPVYGHLLLSASMDTKVKLWDAYNERKVLRTFSGHQAGVRDISFYPDGSKFISASYDKYVKLWDTETGECISRFTSGSVPYCVQVNPKEGKEYEFIVGQANKKIVQWDTRSGRISQTYAEHLGSINTVTYIDHGRKFVSTGDDKRIMVWETGIPVVIKHLSDPTMHSIPATAMHPDGKSMAAQSQDNQVLAFISAGDKFKMNRKKRFTGHSVSGFSCGVTFSPDGQFLASGDASGSCFFWDWNKGKLLSKIQCHDQVTVGVAWHPIEPSKFATCSWDGTIKYWD